MLQINVVLSESYNEETQEFLEETWPLRLEHSLVSLSKWESKYEKPFLNNDEKSVDEVMTYIRMMDLDEETPPGVFQRISNEQYLAINEYINAKRSATWFNETNKSKPNSQTITSELVYYWMTSYEIPWDAENWHLNRLFTLLRVFSAERDTGDKSKKTNTQSLAAQRRALNEKRKKEMQTRG